MVEKIEVVHCADKVNGAYVIHDTRIVHGKMTIVWTEGRGNEIPWIDEEWVHTGDPKEHHVTYRQATPEEEVLINYYLSER